MGQIVADSRLALKDVHLDEPSLSVDDFFQAI
jgi:hypothetical protein